ncbi:MAG: hypothetical protein K9J30_11900 [Bacteroidales bacterium]|nr:hypothetical protein [Bacteroidales bacterium]
MKTKLHLLTLIVFVFFAGCEEEVPDDKPESLKYYEPFKGASPFFSKIPDGAEVDPNSEVMVTSLTEQAEQAFLIAVKEWTVPVYYADASTPRHEVSLTSSWAPKNRLVNVPIPDYAEPDPSADGHMVIVDEAGGCIYDFWEMRFSAGSWKAGWGNAIPSDSDGIFEKGLSARGSGFELMQGVIWPQELEAGVIDHALIFSYDHTKAGGPVAPATESDGTTNADFAIPEGALVQLDPELDLSVLDLNEYETVIAKALQDYGMYCADDGGGLSLYAINPISSKNNPYENIWEDQTYVFLEKIPVDRFRVLKLGPQTDNDAVLVENSCAVFE